MSALQPPGEILIAEDSPTQAQHLAWVLEKRGHPFTIARNGSAALARMRQRAPALVLSDVVMPEMDGYTLCRAIKDDARLRHVPVVLLTSLTDPADVVKGLEAGADSFIFKPFEERDLMARIDSLLANRRLRDGEGAHPPVEVFFAGRRFSITADRLQILNLLLSTYEAAVDRNRELARVQAELTHLNETLEATVAERTRDLAQEIEERKRVELRLQEKLARLQLLRQITRAIGQRTELRQILQVVADSIQQQLPATLCVVALLERERQDMVVCNVAAGSRALAQRLALDEGERVTVPGSGLERCIEGELVHEPDLLQPELPLARRLAQAGLRSLVLSPLQADDTLFGLILTARDDAHAFSSTDCEFLAQLSEHVALAAGQAQLHGALQQAYDDLRQTQQIVLQQERLRALGEMASGIAHDINNALSPVALYTESLLERETGLSERARQQLQTIQRAVDDVSETVARLREFYRPRERGEHHAVSDLNPLVPQVLDLTRARWRDMALQAGVSIDVRTELQPDLPSVVAPEGEIREALTNLVFNAVDAMPAGGTLTLRTALRQSGDRPWVAVEVADTGVGMDEETRRRCLEPFFTTKGERGTGLGLAMVYGTMQRHEGRVEIDSSPGMGTTMRLLFPVSQAGAEPGAGSDLAHSAPRTGAMRLLLIDDDVALARSLSELLRGDGHQVTTAPSGRDGLEVFEQALRSGLPFNAVITDLGMPGMDGRQVAQEIKTLSPRTPVVMLTGWGRRMQEEGERPPCVDHLLGKPPRLAELRAVLAHCISGS